MQTGSSIEKRYPDHGRRFEAAGGGASSPGGSAADCGLNGLSPPLTAQPFVPAVRLHEIFDLPTVFPGASPTPFNRQGSRFETAAAVPAALTSSSSSSSLKEEISRECQRAGTALEAGGRRCRSSVHNLARELPPNLPELRTRAESIGRAVDLGIESGQRITLDNCPGPLDDPGLAAMRRQVEDFEERTGIRMSHRADFRDIPIRPDRSNPVFRIFQEALTATARRARATRVQMTAAASGGILEMALLINGTGSTGEQVRNQKSCGLRGIRERGSFSGGKASITGEADSGTAAAVSIPMDIARVHDDTSACG